MTISLKAYSPADGTAVIKKNNALMLLSAPYRLGSALNVKNLPNDEERTLADAILRQHFYAADEDFDNWDFVFAFLRQKLIDYREQMGKPVPKIDGIEIINSMADNVLQRLLDKAKNELIPQQRFIHTRNFLQNILASDADAGLKAKAQALLTETQRAEQALLIPATIDLPPDVQIRLQETVNRISPDGQRLFIIWLVSSIESQHWDVPKLMAILQDEPLELISDDDVIINIVAQVLRSAVVLFDTREWRRLLKMLINQLICHLKTVDEKRDWEKDFFDISINCHLNEWAIESLPKLFFVKENGDKVVIMIWHFLALCVPTKGLIMATHNSKSEYTTLEISKEIFFEQYKLPLEDCEKGLLESPIKTASERRTVKMFILNFVVNFPDYKKYTPFIKGVSELLRKLENVENDSDKTVKNHYKTLCQ